MKLLQDRFELLNYLDLKDKVCLEIGVWQGEFSEAILSKNPKQLILIDPWVFQKPDIWPDDIRNIEGNDFDAAYNLVCNKFGQDKRVNIIKNYSFFASNEFENDYFDFIYIDGIHTFESCYCDMICWWRTLKANGWMCGHDYVTTFAGVKCAVEAFNRISNTELDILTKDTWTSWGIQKKL